VGFLCHSIILMDKSLMGVLKTTLLGFSQKNIEKPQKQILKI
jgi:hypothetical protein